MLNGESVPNTQPHCNILQHTATLCGTHQQFCNVIGAMENGESVPNTQPHCNTLQHTATHRNTHQQFCDVIGAMLNGESVDALVAKYNPTRDEQKKIRISDDIDEESVRRLFNSLDTNGDGNLTYDEFLRGLAKINVAPKKGEATRMIRISISDPI